MSGRHFTPSYARSSYGGRVVVPVRHVAAGAMRFGRPSPEPPASLEPIGQGELVAYVATAGLPFPAVVIDLTAVEVFLVVCWWPSEASTTRVVPRQKVRPWRIDDDKAWDAARARTIVRRAERGESLPTRPMAPALAP